MKKNHEKNKGLTLIEVLIALSIIAIALTAIIKASTQNIRGTTHVENKMIGTWVGMQVINEIRTGLFVLSVGAEKDGSTNMLGRDWFWQANLTETGNPHIRHIKLNVYEKEDSEAEALVQLEGYLYHAE